MTQPLTPQPHPDELAPPPRISVHFELQEGPDGHPWVKCTLQVGTGSFAFLARADQAEQLSGILGGGFADGVTAARRAQLGLVIAGPGDVPTNGTRPE